MGIDTPITPDPETSPESTPEVAPANAVEAPVTQTAPIQPSAGFEPAVGEEIPLEATLTDEAASPAEPTFAAEAAPSAEMEFAAEAIPPDAGEGMPPVRKKSNMSLIIMAAVFVLAIAAFLAVKFLYLDTTSSQDQQVTLPTRTPAAAPTQTPTATPPRTPAVAPPRTPVPTPAAAPTRTPTPTPTPAVTASTVPVDPLPPPGAPAYAVPKQVTTPVTDIFTGGPMPPKIARFSLKYATLSDLSAAFDKQGVNVSLNPGLGENEAIIIGKATQITKAKAVARTIDVPRFPVVVVASLPGAIPTPTRTFIGEPPPAAVIPVAPPPGRHAGWIYNNNNGQVVAIFEDRSGVAHTVQVGDVIDGMRVISISPDTLVLRDKKNEYKLRLQGLDTYQSRPTVNATPTTTPTAPALPPWR